ARYRGSAHRPRSPPRGGRIPPSGSRRRGPTARSGPAARASTRAARPTRTFARPTHRPPDEGSGATTECCSLPPRVEGHDRIGLVEVEVLQCFHPGEVVAQGADEWLDVFLRNRDPGHPRKRSHNIRSDLFAVHVRILNSCCCGG